MNQYKGERRKDPKKRMFYSVWIGLGWVLFIAFIVFGFLEGAQR